LRREKRGFVRHIFRIELLKQIGVLIAVFDKDQQTWPIRSDLIAVLLDIYRSYPLD
jgi:hypothetical protein